MLKPCSRAIGSMMPPMSRKSVPGLHARIASSKHERVVAMSFRFSSETLSPTGSVVNQSRELEVESAGGPRRTGGVEVPVEAAVVERHIEVDDVSILERSCVRNTCFLELSATRA